jgi:hypothetical protein
VPPSRKPPARRTPRVTETQPKLHMATATLSNKQAPKIQATAMPTNGGVLISAVLAETVPVAQFANVVVGPVGIQWMLGGIDMEDLIDVEWGDIEDDEESEGYGESTFDYEALTPKQRAAYDRVRGATRATLKVLAHQIAEDRESIDRSVRLHNLREAEEDAEQQKVLKAEKQRRRASRG